MTKTFKQFLLEYKHITAYHGSAVPIKKFDIKYFSPEGGFWFSEDFDRIKNNESGAVDTKYIMKVELTVDKVAGWDEYDDLLIDQILDKGFDSIQLDDDWVIFDPKRIKIVDTIKNY